MQTDTQTIIFVVSTEMKDDFKAGKELKRAGKSILAATSHEQRIGWMYQDQFQAGQDAYMQGDDILQDRPTAYTDGYLYAMCSEQANIAEMFESEAHDPMSAEPGYYESTRPWQY